MKRFGKRLICSIITVLLLGAFACNDPAREAETPETTAQITEIPDPQTEETPYEDVIAMPTPTPQITPEPTPEPTEEPTPTPEPTATSIPTPAVVTIGAVGDIMIPSVIVESFKTTDQTYDFSTLFLPMREWFESVDLMCGNLEVPLAGADRGYSGKKDENTGLYSFNAPDSLLEPLKAYGVDMLTTANNHMLDKGLSGLHRTVEVIRAAGFYQTGTYLNEEDRLTPCIVEINGVKIGFVASTRLMNELYSDCTREEALPAFGYFLKDGKNISQELKDSLARTREAGAEFVILFAHWDHENDEPTAADTKEYARQAIAAGADCIIGSHPHRIKNAEYVTVERKDGPYTGLVLYSLGNFTANSDFQMMVGLFAKITLEKDFKTGAVSLIDAGILPTVTIRRSEKTQRFAVVPAYEDPSTITGLSSELVKSEINAIRNARTLAFKRFGTVEGIRILETPTE